MKNLPQMNRINADFNTFVLSQGKKIQKPEFSKSKTLKDSFLSRRSCLSAFICGES